MNLSLLLKFSRTKFEGDLQHLAEQKQERQLLQFDLLKTLSEMQVEIEAIKAANPDFQPLSEANVEQLKSASWLTGSSVV